METNCGSTAYKSPEIILGQSYNPQSLDIWCLGIVLYSLLSAELPFEESSTKKTINKIANISYKMKDHFSPEVQELITMILQPEKTRATLKDIKESAFFKKYT